MKNSNSKVSVEILAQEKKKRMLEFMKLKKENRRLLNSLLAKYEYLFTSNYGLMPSESIVYMKNFGRIIPLEYEDPDFLEHILTFLKANPQKIEINEK